MRWKKLSKQGGALRVKVAVSAGAATGTMNIKFSLEIDTAMGMEVISER